MFGLTSTPGSGKIGDCRCPGEGFLGRILETDPGKRRERGGGRRRGRPRRPVAAAREAKARGAREFSIVSSGLAMRNRGELERVGNAIERIRSEVGIETCVSLGTLSAEDVSYLLSRGLRSLHHTLA